jgi:glycosyltransferase involved in cell wall biosynthesis
MKIAILSPVAWRTPPRHYGPWEQVSSNICEGLVKQGHEVSLFATGDSITESTLYSITETGYAENQDSDAKVLECLHISNLMEQADQFDIIHNNFDFLPLTYSKLIKTPIVTTIHGFSSPKIIPVFKKYNDNSHYVSISNSDRSEQLNYIATVYNGLNTEQFTLQEQHGDYLLYFGRIHPDKGTYEAIQIAKKKKMKLIISGLIQDSNYFTEKVEPYLNNTSVVYVGNSGPEERDKLLGGAYAMLHPISFEEPFGLSVAESMLCGTPVIAFNKGSMSELIANQKTGFLVKNIDEACAALEMVKNIDRNYCRTWAKSNFSCEKMVDDYVKVYEKIVNGK